MSISMIDLILDATGKFDATPTQLATAKLLRVMYNVYPTQPSYVALARQRHMGSKFVGFWDFFWKYRLEEAVYKSKAPIRENFVGLYNCVMSFGGEYAMHTLATKDDYATPLELEILRCGQQERLIPHAIGYSYINVNLSRQQHVWLCSYRAKSGKSRRYILHEAAARLLWTDVKPLASDNPFAEEMTFGGELVFSERLQAESYLNAMMKLLRLHIDKPTASECMRYALGLMWEARHDHRA